MLKRLSRKPRRRPEADRPLERAPPFGDQVVARIADALGLVPRRVAAAAAVPHAWSTASAISSSER